TVTTPGSITPFSISSLQKHTLVVLHFTLSRQHRHSQKHITHLKSRPSSAALLPPHTLTVLCQQHPHRLPMTIPMSNPSLLVPPKTMPALPSQPQTKP
ncbi:hypothetical protein P7K49_034636, partial [Saguinus oedipus]